MSLIKRFGTSTHGAANNSRVVGQGEYQTKWRYSYIYRFLFASDRDIAKE